MDGYGEILWGLAIFTIKWKPLCGTFWETQACKGWQPPSDFIQIWHYLRNGIMKKVTKEGGWFAMSVKSFEREWDW